MLLKRVIPVLLLDDGGLVKTKSFSNPTYIGDPVNAVKIYNEKEVDELIILDIHASKQGRTPNIEIITEIAGECFTPLCYGGGVRTLDDIRNITSSGVEKVCINSAALKDPTFIRRAADIFGSSTIVVCVDYKKNSRGILKVFAESGTVETKWTVEEWAEEAARLGAGELMLQSIERDGMYCGYDVSLVQKIAQRITIPIIACGGASCSNDFETVITEGKAAAAAAGSLFVYYTKTRGILINYPDKDEFTR